MADFPQFALLSPELQYECIKHFSNVGLALTVSKRFYRFIRANANRLHKRKFQTIEIVNVNSEALKPNWRTLDNIDPEDRPFLRPTEYILRATLPDDRLLPIRSVVDLNSASLWQFFAHIQTENILLECVHVSFKLMELIRRLRIKNICFYYCYFSEVAAIPIIFENAYKNIDCLGIFEPAGRLFLPITSKVNFCQFTSIVIEIDTFCYLDFFDSKFLIRHLGDANCQIEDFCLSPFIQTNLEESGIIKLVEKISEHRRPPKFKRLFLGSISNNDIIPRSVLPVKFETDYYAWSIEKSIVPNGYEYYAYHPYYTRLLSALFDPTGIDELWLEKCDISYTCRFNEYQMEMALQRLRRKKETVKRQRSVSI